MKRLVLKKWVEYLLITLTFMSILVLGAECNDIKIFIGSKFISLIIGLISTSLLYKYGSWNYD